MNGAHDIGPVQLAISCLLILVAGICSWLYRLKLEKDLFIGTVRAFVQLFLVGYVLKLVFHVGTWWLVLLAFTSMVFWATLAARARVKKNKIPVFWDVFGTMFIGYFAVTFMVTYAIINVEPWYKPQYFIPLAGMIVGNSMNAIAISLERLFSSIRKQKSEVELRLCLGATSHEATSEVVEDSIRAGMIPSINGLMTVGLVSLPGMMTGQILAGSDPIKAIKYQIVVMLMITASTAIGSLVVVSLARRKAFTKSHQIRV